MGNKWQPYTKKSFRTCVACKKSYCIKNGFWQHENAGIYKVVCIPCSLKESYLDLKDKADKLFDELNKRHNVSK